MVVRLRDTVTEPCHQGLRMSAAEFLALPETTERYELIDGVVVMSPSASFGHQDIAGELQFQIRSFLELHPGGRVVTDVDVQLGARLVYRPDLIYLSAAKAARVTHRVTEPPDLIVEVISPESRARDTRTKRDDYERAGVGEYWLIDPELGTFQFLVLREGRYVETPAGPEHYTSTVVAGFQLDLARVRRLFAV